MATVKVAWGVGEYKYRFGIKRVVYITSAEMLDKIDAGETEIMPVVGWPPEDVFEYDETVEIENVDWTKLTLWQPQQPSAKNEGKE
jgi:hypothetical protein